MKHLFYKGRVEFVLNKVNKYYKRHVKRRWANTLCTILHYMNTEDTKKIIFDRGYS